LQRGIEGSAAVRYVVDTLGNVDTLTYRVVSATHEEFALAVRRALPHMRFRPAVQGGQRVRQLVQQTFTFRVTRRDTVPPDAESPA
jgi:TonB family protein